MRQMLLATLFLAPFAASTTALAGESYDNCSGFIDSLPATITTQGVWCLRADLATAITSGNAITVTVNNVTIDCNDFKLGGLGGGYGSQARGIRSDRLNTTVRNCNIRGFFFGLDFIGASHNALIESNRFDGNLVAAMTVHGRGTMVRDNLVLDTGGSTVVPEQAIGIHSVGILDIVGNTVVDVSATGSASFAHGISTTRNYEGTVRDNRIKGVVATGVGSIASGIENYQSEWIVVRGNDIQGTGAANSTGLRCSSNKGISMRNVVAGFATGMTGCVGAGNYSNIN